jgi:hypothetical protein
VLLWERWRILLLVTLRERGYRIQRVQKVRWFAMGPKTRKTLKPILWSLPWVFPLITFGADEDGVGPGPPRRRNTKCNVDSF